MHDDDSIEIEKSSSFLTHSYLNLTGGVDPLLSFVSGQKIKH